MRRPGTWLASGLIALTALALGAAGCGGSSSTTTTSGSGGGSSSTVPAHVNGGTLNVALHGSIDFTDPAMAYYQPSWQLLYDTCVNLLNYPDKAGSAGLQLQPEAASAMPTVTNNGKTYTFNVPPGKFHFNTGQPVTAATFQYTLDRDLNPKQASPMVNFLGQYVVGASSYKGVGHVSGIQVQGNKLIINLTKQYATIIPVVATPFACAVPIGTPINSKGQNTVPGAGPYYVASYTPNKSVVLKRNPNYHGTRPHYLNEIDVSQLQIDENQGLLEVKNGTLDYCPDCVTAAQTQSLYQSYGPGSTAASSGDQRYFVSPNVEVDYYAFNTSPGKALDNPLVREAINYAVDRTHTGAQLGYKIETPTDKILPPGMPGASDEQSIYPNSPDLSKAKSLMKQSGVKTPLNLVVYSTSACPACTNRMTILQQDLKPLGITITVKTFVRAVQFQQEGIKPGKMDISDEGWLMDFPDPYDFINVLLNGEAIPATNGVNFSYFNVPKYNQAMDKAATLVGNARYTAYGQLATQMFRDDPPWAAFGNRNNTDFFSARVGCTVYQPVYGMDYATMCIRK